jgi:hypothetical protein
MDSSYDNFKIALIAKKFFIYLYDISYNIPKKDTYIKNKVINTSYELMYSIYLANYSLDNFKSYIEVIKTNIALLDYLCEILLTKKYISKKQLEYLIHNLTQLNKMTASWIKYKEGQDA